MEVLDPEDQIKAFRARLVNLNNEMLELHNERLNFAEKWKPKLRKTLIPAALEQLSDAVMQHLMKDNAELQEMLNVFDAELTASKENASRLAEAWPAVLGAVSDMRLVPASADSFGAIMVEGTSAEAFLARSEGGMHEAVSNIIGLRHKQETLLAWVEEKLSLRVESQCTQLQQMVEASSAAVQQQQQMLHAAQQDLDQATHIIEKLVTMKGAAECLAQPPASR